MFMLVFTDFQLIAVIYFLYVKKLSLNVYVGTFTRTLVSIPELNDLSSKLYFLGLQIVDIDSVQIQDEVLIQVSLTLA